MGDFDGTPLVAGSIFGGRSFAVDNLGRLKGPQAGTIHRSGENIAECDSCIGEKTVETCTHGFYAYTDGSTRYRNTDTVEGVIEGYGITQIGTKGFRSEKSKIVALHLPAPKKEPLWVTPVRWAQKAHFYDGWSVITWILSGLGLIGFGITSAICKWPGDEDHKGPTSYPTAASIFLILALICAFVIFFSIYGENSKKYSRRTRIDRKDKDRLILRNKKIRAAYPNVKYFTDYRDMMIEYKLAEPIITPEVYTPDHPDFWTVGT